MLTVLWYTATGALERVVCVVLARQYTEMRWSGCVLCLEAVSGSGMMRASVRAHVYLSVCVHAGVGPWLCLCFFFGLCAFVWALCCAESLFADWWYDWRLLGCQDRNTSRAFQDVLSLFCFVSWRSVWLLQEGGYDCPHCSQTFKVSVCVSLGLVRLVVLTVCVGLAACDSASRFVPDGLAGMAGLPLEGGFGAAMLRPSLSHMSRTVPSSFFRMLRGMGPLRRSPSSVRICRWISLRMAMPEAWPSVPISSASLSLFTLCLRVDDGSTSASWVALVLLFGLVLSGASSSSLSMVCGLKVSFVAEPSSCPVMAVSFANSSCRFGAGDGWHRLGLGEVL